ncbi:MAG TPA: hypothetical protein ENN43_01340 [bacterium]|nr:hypothetical protein [bacterium]
MGKPFSLKRQKSCVLFNGRTRVFFLSAKDSLYALGISGDKRLYHAYYGKNLSAGARAALKEPGKKELAYHSPSNRGISLLPEIEIYDGHNVFENTLKIKVSGSGYASDFVYRSHKISGNRLDIALKDRKYPVYVILHYEVYPDNNIIRRSITVNNRGSATLHLENYYSGCLALPAGDYKAGCFHGSWANEMNMIFEPLTAGKKVLESRTGNPGHLHNPSFFITRAKNMSEENGEYYYGQLFCGGNWKLVFEKRFYGAVCVTGGINDFNGPVTLKPGGSFTTPDFITGFSSGGLGQMSRDVHDFHRQHTLPQANIHNYRRILVNSWEAFYFSVDEKKFERLADAAVKTGAELVVIDDGWFGGRYSDRTSLGDWEENRKKFPSGIRALARKVREKGLMFGIWIEPEMVNPESALYKKHPGWCHHYAGRKKTEMRNQLVLNISKSSVRKYLKRVIGRIIKKYDPDYIKWDMNRYMSEVSGGEKAWRGHTEAVYELMSYLRALKPSIILEGCAGGGGRFAPAFMKYTDQMWTSDNNDPFSRLYIQHSASLFYPAQAMCCHAADSPYGITGRASRTQFRIHAAMAGNFGTEADITRWNAADLKLLAENIEIYKGIRDIIFTGDLYRLEPPHDGARVSFMYVSKNKKRAVVYAFMQAKPGPKPGPLKLKGLKAGAVYEIDFGEMKKSARGDELMKRGLDAGVRKTQDSAVITLSEKA